MYANNVECPLVAERMIQLCRKFAYTGGRSVEFPPRNLTSLSLTKNTPMNSTGVNWVFNQTRCSPRKPQRVGLKSQWKVLSHLPSCPVRQAGCCQPSRGARTMAVWWLWAWQAGHLMKLLHSFSVAPLNRHRSPMSWQWQALFRLVSSRHT